MVRINAKSTQWNLVNSLRCVRRKEARLALERFARASGLAVTVTFEHLGAYRCAGVFLRFNDDFLRAVEIRISQRLDY